MKPPSFDYIPPLLPVGFFNVSARIDRVSGKKTKLTKLPLTADLLVEEDLISASLGWSLNGLYLEMEVLEPFTEAFLPAYEKGDSLEIFIDTRDLKTTAHATRFCHHFVILPQPVSGIHAKEETHFRSDDAHPLCLPEEIDIKTTILKNGYKCSIFFPSHILHGYDPASFKKMGFTYRVNRTKKTPLHYSVSSSEALIAGTPSLWASLILNE